MKAIPITEFKAKCLRLVDEVNTTGETIEITRRGKIVAVVCAPTSTIEIDWTPGAFRDNVQIVGDLDDLGVEWEALK